jgi:anthranilate/para-aminobenzoate synthase component I
MPGASEEAKASKQIEAAETSKEDNAVEAIEESGAADGPFGAVRISRTTRNPQPADVAACVSIQSNAAILESSQGTGYGGRYSIFATEPAYVVEPGAGEDLAATWDRLRKTVDHLNHAVSWDRGCVVDSKDAHAIASEGHRPAASDYPRPHPRGIGWIGYITYEAGLDFEARWRDLQRLPDVPLLRWAFYDAALIFDHQERCWFAEVIDWSAVGRAAPIEDFAEDGNLTQPPSVAALRQRPSAAERQATLEQLLAQADKPAMEPSAGAPAAIPVANAAEITAEIPRTEIPPAEPLSGAAAEMNEADHARAVRRVLDHIHAGDVYQVNLTQRFQARTAASPSTHYQRLRAISPATHAAFLSWARTAVMTCSSELFLASEPGGRVVTRPIKGTAPRGRSCAEDDQNRHALAHSEKDAAELNMIVDLLRNDLGRVCEYGSVHVLEGGAVEAWPTVFHRVATIEGTLRRDVGWFELLRATFPGGSITGAPKIRAMQIIRTLEPTPRSVYCGAIGRIGLDGTLNLNVAIRTLVQQDDTASWYAGGGIVADSDPAAEYRELRAKAGALFRTVGLPPDADVYTEPSARCASPRNGAND